jgi:hypothetical protein
MDYNTSNNTALDNLCVYARYVSNGYASIQVIGTTAETTTLTFDTNASDCYAAAPAGSTPLQKPGGTKMSKNNAPNPAPLGVVFAGLLLAGFLGRHSRKFRTMAVLIVLLAATLAVSSCSSSNSPTNPLTGTYTITLTGHDSVTSSITAQTTFTLTIQ